jgi:hypothetical protein
VCVQMRGSERDILGERQRVCVRERPVRFISHLLVLANVDGHCADLAQICLASAEVRGRPAQGLELGCCNALEQELILKSVGVHLKVQTVDLSLMHQHLDKQRIRVIRVLDLL